MTDQKDYDHTSRDPINNAVSAAFRKVVGWCPVRDGVPQAKDGRDG